jgi:hypothetical protein
MTASSLHALGAMNLDALVLKGYAFPTALKNEPPVAGLAPASI